MSATDTRQDTIDLFDSSCVELWCAALAVSTAELVEAVKLVGDSGERVAEYIHAKRGAPSARPFM